MALLNSYPTPPPYSRLDEDTTKKSGTGSADAHEPGHPAFQGEGKVAISLESSLPNHVNPSKLGWTQWTLKSFLCGSSLRVGCITVAVLYSFYLVFFTGITVMGFIVTYVQHEKIASFPAIWGINVAVFECCIAAFIIAFVSLGIHKTNAVHLHVAKWFMILDICLNILEEIQIAILLNVFGLVFHFIMQLLPVYFVFVIHSYEIEIKMEFTKSDRNSTNPTAQPNLN